ncbi:MerR family transcriptional regulator [Flexivirga caeni]|uniref:MerR family transcriptional regulator n=1 Tax=Flexivirga caeni TaxID=2294115 RepID=A0A3M9LZH0_9MICO|nr:MerR family transcriptional regulator [Flexivirga caeni]RNI17748.1 MerR family transcriptional regulator [Flexivirga caeni]
MLTSRATLSIGQLAAYAGVTVRTVRHYHAKGLLPEPARDCSGYRRYDASAVIDLIRIRTLADAGVPLSRARELLAAGPEEFAAAIDEVDRRLRAEIRERQRHRARIAQLAAGDRVALPTEAVAYLDRLRDLGFSELFVSGERDAWILVAARLPEQMPLYMAAKQQQLADPATLALYRDLAAAVEWDAADPRLVGVADRLVGLLEAAHPAGRDSGAGGVPESLAALLDSIFMSMVPTAPRLRQLVEERGWTGWTNFTRIAQSR